MSLIPVFAPRLRVRRLGASDHDVARWCLLGDVDAHAFLLGWLDHHGVVPTDPDRRFAYVGAYRGPSLVGVGLFVAGSVCCLGVGSSVEAEALAVHARQRPMPLQVVLGRADHVDAFVDRYASGGRSSMVRRTPQRLLSMGSRDLRFFGVAGLIRAELSDCESVVAATLEMHDEDVAGARATESERIALADGAVTRVESGHTWVVRDPVDNALLFKASVASDALEAAQIEGVWVPPAARRKGLARQALGELCRELLMTHDRVTLYADASNHAALGLYQRLGFSDAGAWCTTRLTVTPTTLG